MFWWSQILQPLTPLLASPIFVKEICLSNYNLNSFLIHQASFSKGYQWYLMHREILGSIWKIGRYPIKVSEVLTQGYAFEKMCFYELYKKLRHNLRFPTMWYVRPAKLQTSLRIRAAWSEPLLVTWMFWLLGYWLNSILVFLSLKGGCTDSSSGVYNCTGGKPRNYHEIVLMYFCSQATSRTRRGSVQAEKWLKKGRCHFHFCFILQLRTNNGKIRQCGSM